MRAWRSIAWKSTVFLKNKPPIFESGSYVKPSNAESVRLLQVAAFLFTTVFLPAVLRSCADPRFLEMKRFPA